MVGRIVSKRNTQGKRPQWQTHQTETAIRRIGCYFGRNPLGPNPGQMTEQESYEQLVVAITMDMAPVDGVGSGMRQLIEAVLDTLIARRSIFLKEGRWTARPEFIERQQLMSRRVNRPTHLTPRGRKVGWHPKRIMPA